MIGIEHSAVLTARRAGRWWRSPVRALAGLLLLSEFAYAAMLRLDAVSSARSVFLFLGLLACLFLCYSAAYLLLRDVQNSHRAIILVIFGALLFRFTLLFAGLPHDSNWSEMQSGVKMDVRGRAVAYDRFLLYDNDVWRYLWDGHVWTNGINPYRYEPSNPRLDALTDSGNSENTIWSDIRDNVNHPQIPTIYPPAAELVFGLSHVLAPGSVLVMKSIFVGFDLLALFFIALTLRALHRPASDMILYAWNPLVIKTVAGSGHMDAIMAAALAATAYFIVRGRRAHAAIAWGVSVLTKISPLVLLPFVMRRLGWRKSALGIGVVVLGYLPFMGAGRLVFAGLQTFAQSWQFNAGFYGLVQWLARPLSHDPVLLAKAASGVVIFLILACLVRNDDAEDNSFAFYSTTALGALVVLGPTVMPWYLVWLLPLAVIANARIWIYFSASVCLAFLVMINGTEHPAVILLEYGILAVLLSRNYSLLGRNKQTGKFAQVLAAYRILDTNQKTLIGEKL